MESYSGSSCVITMNKQTSIRLDALRACAALLVFGYHFSYLGYTGHAVPWALSRIGVLMFFLMSGYVIAYVTEHKHPNLEHYATARVARLCSVFIPALAITAICDAAGRSLHVDLYARYPSVYDVDAWLQLPFFLTFSFENSFLSLRWFSDGPMWSIAYEFWYYAIYGVLFYTRGAKRVAFTLVTMLLAGWKIMLLAPIWFAGVLLYKNEQKIRSCVEPYRVLLFFLSALTLIFFIVDSSVRTLPQELGNWIGAFLGDGQHSYFLSDYLYTMPLLVLVAGLIGSGGVAPGATLKRIVVGFANFSFSLYLYHVPLIILLRATSLYDTKAVAQSLVVAMVVIFCCYLLATITEHKKYIWLKAIRATFAAFPTLQERTEKNAGKKL
jgi:peptidoglycan/LPS O-acetylase OafA/YrhL